MAPSGSLVGRWALVTGASRGIGAECARLLRAEGANLILIARDLERMRDLVRSFGREGPTVAVLAGDLAELGMLDKLLSGIRSFVQTGPDIVVNNAATFFLRLADDTGVDEFQQAYTVNVTAAFAIIHEFLPDMRSRGAGHLVTIGSIADHRAFRGNAAYGASKYALRGLHEVLRAELRGTGIRTTLVSPGHTDTGIWLGADAELARGAPSPDRMLDAVAVAEAVRWAVTRPADVNVDEIRVERS